MENNFQQQILNLQQKISELQQHPFDSMEIIENLEKVEKNFLKKLFVSYFL